MAVYQARGVLPDCQLELINEDICYPSQEREAIFSHAKRNSEVQIAPNPNRGEFIVRANNSLGKRLILYNVLGNVIKDQHFDTEISAYTISEKLTEGTYFCLIVSDDGQYRMTSFSVVR